MNDNRRKALRFSALRLLVLRTLVYALFTIIRRLSRKETSIQQAAALPINARELGSGITAVEVDAAVASDPMTNSLPEVTLLFVNVISYSSRLLCRIQKSPDNIQSAD